MVPLSHFVAEKEPEDDAKVTHEKSPSRPKPQIDSKAKAKNVPAAAPVPKKGSFIVRLEAEKLVEQIYSSLNPPPT